jgi:hypothetical protein
MSWLLSRAFVNSLSSPEQVEEYLGASSLDGEPSAPSSGNPTPQAYCAPDKTTVFSRLSRFGMTFKPLTEDRGAELLMSYLAAFPARTSQSPEKGPESKESAAECGNTWRGWLAKYDPDTSSWRTAQCSLLEDLTESLETLPRSGMTRGGLLWELPMLERRTKETGSGLWATPQHRDFRSGQASRWDDPRRTRNLNDQVAKWPTPTSSVGGANHNSPSVVSGKRFAMNLAGAVQSFPTPTRRDYKSGTGAQDRPGHSPPLSNVIGGTLNPTWVEWLMGWPLGWTDLKPLEMDKSHSAPQQPGDI